MEIDINRFKGNRQLCEGIATKIHGSLITNSEGFTEEFKYNSNVKHNDEWETRLRLEFNANGLKVNVIGDFNICIYENGNIEYQNAFGSNLKMNNLLEVYKLIIEEFIIKD